MSEETPKPQSEWSKPRYSIKQLLGCFATIVVVAVVVGAIALFAMLVNAGAQ